MRPLLVIVRPRDLPEFLESQKSIKIDKLWVNYYNQNEAWKVARDEALKTDYTHFFFTVDDNIFTQRDINRLIDDCNVCETDVISGWMNSNTTTHKDDANISMILPPNPPNQGIYEDYDLIKIKDVEGRIDIITVKYQGFALTLMTREILERFPFRDSAGCCVDSCFAWDLHEAGIKQYVDLRVRCKHLKVDGKTQLGLLQVGLKDKHWMLEKTYQ